MALDFPSNTQGSKALVNSAKSIGNEGAKSVGNAVIKPGKKRWHGDQSGGGVKTALGVKRKPNRKDRERARAQLGIAASGDAAAAQAGASTKPKAPKVLAPVGKGMGGGGGTGQAGSKRKFGEGSTPFDRADKHKQHKPEVKSAPAQPRPAPTVPKSEKGQKIQELLRQKMAKSKVLKGPVEAAAEIVAAQPAPASSANSCVKPASSEGGAGTARSADEDARRDADVTVVLGKVATGKVSSNWQALKKDLKKEKRLEKKGKKGGSADAAASTSHTPGSYLPSQLELINSVGPLAVDCEMVGVGDGGHRSVLARVSIVDAHGDTIMGLTPLLFAPSTSFSLVQCVCAPCNTHLHAIVYVWWVFVIVTMCVCVRARARVYVHEYERVWVCRWLEGASEVWSRRVMRFETHGWRMRNLTGSE